MSDVSYEAAVSYDAERIGLIDRNVARIVGQHIGRQITDRTNYRKGDIRREITCAFATKSRRQRFIQEMRKFLKTANFGVMVSVERVGN